MAERESLYLWSTTALTNGSADPNINFAEGQLPSSVNNSARSEMAAVARWLKDFNGSVSTAGSANAYTLTINQTMTAYATGHLFGIKASFANTGAATLNITNADSTAIGAKAIRVFTPSGEAALSANMIVVNGHYILRYDSAANSSAGAFILLNPTDANALQASNNLSDVASSTTARSNLGAFKRSFGGSSVSLTNQTHVDWTGLPSGVTRLTITVGSLSTNGTSNPIIQLGTSGGFKTTGYTGSAVLPLSGGANSANNDNTGMLLGNSFAAATTISGYIDFVPIDQAANTWAAIGIMGASNNANAFLTACSLALGGTLTQVRLTTENGTDQFDNGVVNIMYDQP